MSEYVIHELCVLPCVCSPGYSYGCVVKKKVVFLEELKRDTPDFGERLFRSLNFMFHMFTRSRLKAYK